MIMSSSFSPAAVPYRVLVTVQMAGGQAQLSVVVSRASTSQEKQPVVVDKHSVDRRSKPESFRGHCRTVPATSATTLVIDHPGRPVAVRAAMGPGAQLWRSRRDRGQASFPDWLTALSGLSSARFRDPREQSRRGVAERGECLICASKL